MERLSSRVKNFGEFRRENNPQHLEAQVCLRLSKISAFFILHTFYFSRIGRRRLRQAVCKTVASLSCESSNLSRCTNFLYFRFRERNSTGWVAVFQTECCGFKSRRSLQFLQARSFNRQNVGLQNRSFQFKSERACQFYSSAAKCDCQPHTSHFPRGRQAKSVWQQFRKLPRESAYGFESCVFRQIFGGVAQRN